MNTTEYDPSVKHRLFILGAGFSAASGIPMTSQLLRVAMEMFRDECPGLFKRVDWRARTCFSLGDRDPDYSRVSLPDLCTFLEYLELREHGGRERWSEAGSKEKCALRFYLSKAIVSLTPEGTALPGAFVDQLSDRDVILTFNWDCLLEEALQRTGRPYSYAYEEGRVNIIKLHGSVNWRLFDSGHPSVRYEPLGVGEEPRLPEVFFSDSARRWGFWERELPFQRLEPFIVLPGFGKAFDVRLLSTFWYKLEWSVWSTYDTYIIGLSCSPDDFFIRSYFLDNFKRPGSRGTAPPRKVLVINPADDAVRNYAFMTSTGVAELLLEPFSEVHVRGFVQRLKIVSTDA